MANIRGSTAQPRNPNKTYPDGVRTWSNDITDRKSGSGWLEPESVANIDETQPQYPFNHATLGESGHLLEVDDTPKRERIRFTHRTGTFIEMHPNGDMVQKVFGDSYEITVCDKNVLIEGHASVTVKGDCVLRIEGDKIEKVFGDYYLNVDGNFYLTSKGDASLLSQKDLTVGAGTSITSPGIGTGALRFASGQDIYVTGDIMCGGVIVADILSAKYSVDAGLGVTAGPLGFVTLYGGVSCGYPVAIPYSVNAAQWVNAPLGTFSTMSATLMTDVINSTIYNWHIHGTSSGPTSPPMPKFVGGI